METKPIYKIEYPEIPADVANGRLDDMARWMLATWTGCSLDEAAGLLALGRELGRLRRREAELLVSLVMDALDPVAKAGIEIELANIDRDLVGYGRLLAEVQL